MSNYRAKDELIPLWLEALRSGKYKQGQHRLAKIDKENGSETFCCLGVLCEVAGLERERVQVKASYGYTDYDAYSYEGETSVLPPHFDHHMALNTGVLVSMNDCGQDFAYIATEIERMINE